MELDLTDYGNEYAAILHLRDSDVQSGELSESKLINIIVRQVVVTKW